MIDQQQVQASGFNLIDPTHKAAADKAAKRAALKKLAPQLVNSDGQVDLQALQDFIDLAHTTSNNKGYELTFAGKGLARAQADSETNYELKVEKEQSKAFEDTENVVMRGDNLEVLKILKQNYFEKIKMIYIDPPYNTKSENFIYKDNFKQTEAELIENFGLDENTTDFLQNVYGTRSHSGWLSFMYPRLTLARDLLREDGVIFISIDDNEQANLKIMCDEIFGEENFVSSMIWKKTENIKMDSKFFSVNKDFILVYKKDSIQGFEKVFSDISRFKLKDEKGLYYLRKLDSKSSSYSKSLDYIIEYNGVKHYAGGSYEKYKQRQSKGGDKKDCIWLWSQTKFKEGLANGEIVFKNGNVYNKVRFDGIAKKPYTDFIDAPSGQSSQKNLNQLFEEKRIFDHPKPTDLIKHFLKMSATKNDLILDFFAGSGTTGDAVMQLNAEDDGQRKFILVQWDEKIKQRTEAYKFCRENDFQPVISSITIERLNRAGEKLKSQNTGKLELENQTLDLGYKVFSLTEKPKLIQDENGLFKPQNRRTHTIDTLANMLCATCKPLNTKIKELLTDKLYEADAELYILGAVEAEHLEPYRERQIYLDGWGDFSLEDWLNLEVGQKENINVVY